MEIKDPEVVGACDGGANGAGHAGTGCEVGSVVPTRRYEVVTDTGEGPPVKFIRHQSLQGVLQRIEDVQPFEPSWVRTME